MLKLIDLAIFFFNFENVKEYMGDGSMPAIRLRIGAGVRSKHAIVGGRVKGQIQP